MTHRRTRTGPRVNKHREAHKHLWAASFGMPAPPLKFDATKTYRVKLHKSVTPKDHSFPLRPDQEVFVSGAVAEEIRDCIRGAAEV